MRCNYPFRTIRREKISPIPTNYKDKPNEDYYTENVSRHHQIPLDDRKFIRSLQRTERIKNSIGSYSSSSRKKPRRKEQTGLITLNQYLRNKVNNSRQKHCVQRMRCHRLMVNNSPRSKQQSLKHYIRSYGSQENRNPSALLHEKRKQQILSSKELSVKKKLEKKALEIYQRQISTRKRCAADSDPIKYSVREYVRSRKQHMKSYLYFTEQKDWNNQREPLPSGNCKMFCDQQQQTNQDQCLNVPKPLTVQSNSDNIFEKLLSFKQPSAPSIKTCSMVQKSQVCDTNHPSSLPICEKNPSNNLSNVNLNLKHSFYNDQIKITPSPTLPRDATINTLATLDGLLSDDSHIPPVQILSKPLQDYTTPTKLINPLRDDSVSGSGSSNSLKLESNIIQRVVRRFGGGSSRISSRLININTIRTSKLSHNPEFDELIEKIELHMEIVNTIAEYVENSGNLYNQSLWQCENFMMYKRYYAERLRIQETLNGNRNCFTLNQVTIQKVCLIKYQKAPEICALYEQIYRQNIDIYKCLEQMLANLNIKNPNHPTLNVSFDRITINRLKHDIILAFQQEFDTLKKTLLKQTDEEKHSAVEWRLIDIIQLTYLLEELSDNFIKSFVECEEVENFEQFMLENEPIFASIVKKYKKLS